MSPTTLVLLAVAAFTAGVVDAIAGGGGLITLPALLAAGLPPQIALGTNKGQAVFGAVSSAASFWTRGGVDRDRAPIGFAFGLAGSVVGALVLLTVPNGPLKPIVLGLLGFAAVVVLTPRRKRDEAMSAKSPWLAAPIALALGFYDGFFGPGTGSILIVAFVLVYGEALTRASGNAKIVNLASNLAAFGIFAYRGTIVWPVALSMAGANALGAFTGARIALKRGDRFVRVVIIVVVASLLAKVAYDVATR